MALATAVKVGSVTLFQQALACTNTNAVPPSQLYRRCDEQITGALWTAAASFIDHDGLKLAFLQVQPPNSIVF
jgi:hypothetical protein